MDSRLSRFTAYKVFSRMLQSRYHSVMHHVGRSTNQSDMFSYIENFDDIPVRTDTVLFECAAGYEFSGVVMEIYRGLMKSSSETGNIRIIWVIANGITPPHEITRDPRVALVNIGSTEYGIALLEAAHLINDRNFPTWFIRRDNQKYLNCAFEETSQERLHRIEGPLLPFSNTQRNTLQASSFSRKSCLEETVSFLNKTMPGAAKNSEGTSCTSIDNRQRILIFPGGLNPNGITTSLKNLLDNLDYDRFNPYIVLDTALLDRENARRDQLNEIDSRCNWILRAGNIFLKSDEKELSQRFKKGDQTLTRSDLEVIRKIFKRECIRVFGALQFDIAIDFSGYSPYWSALISCTDAKHKVCYQHNNLWAEYSNSDPSRKQKQLYSVFQTYRWFDQVVSVSDETRKINQENLKKFEIGKSPIRTVRNTININGLLRKASVPLELVHPNAKVLYKNPDTFRFIALGRLSPEKRYDRMLTAFCKVVSEFSNVSLLICGSGPLHEKLKELTAQQGLQDNVTFLGQVSNPYPLLARADACVMSSDYEGQPMALLEALCLGTHCIGSDIPGIQAVLKNGRGQLVPPTEEAFENAMLDAVKRHSSIAKVRNIESSYVDDTMDEFYRTVCLAKTPINASPSSSPNVK